MQEGYGKLSIIVLYFPSDLWEETGTNRFTLPSKVYMPNTFISWFFLERYDAVNMTL